MLSLCLWSLLGLVHTSFSFIRTGFPPNRPPAVGIKTGALAEEVALLSGLVGQIDQGRVLILLPPATDSGLVVFLRYQLAYIDYPVRVFARRLRQDIRTEVANEELVVTRTGTAFPPGWQETARRDSFAAYRRTRP